MTTAPGVLRLATRGSPLALWQAERVAGLLAARRCRGRTGGGRHRGGPAYRRAAVTARRAGGVRQGGAGRRGPRRRRRRRALGQGPARLRRSWVSRDWCWPPSPSGATPATCWSARPGRRPRRPGRRWRPARPGAGSNSPISGPTSPSATCVATWPPAWPGSGRTGSTRSWWRGPPSTGWNGGRPRGSPSRRSSRRSCCPRSAQGALAVECRVDDGATRRALAVLDDLRVRRGVEAERAFLAELGGGCTLPVGAFAVLEHARRVPATGSGRPAADRHAGPGRRPRRPPPRGDRARTGRPGPGRRPLPPRRRRRRRPRPVEPRVVTRRPGRGRPRRPRTAHRAGCRTAGAGRGRRPRPADRPRACSTWRRTGAELVDVGKGPGQSGRQADINDLLVALGRSGRRIVRLKGGDPFVFGRGGEEAEALRRAGIEVEVVPGVTSAFAAPAAAGIPVTHRTRVDVGDRGDRPRGTRRSRASTGTCSAGSTAPSWCSWAWRPGRTSPSACWPPAGAATPRWPSSTGGPPSTSRWCGRPWPDCPPSISRHRRPS